MIDPTAMALGALGNSLGNYQNMLIQQHQMSAQMQMQQAAMMQQPAAPQMGLQQALTPFGNTLGSLYGNASPAPAYDGAFEMRRAEYYTEEGERIIDRIAVWSAFSPIPILGLFADWQIAKLLRNLDETTDEIGRWLEMAARHLNDNKKEPTEPERS